MIRVLLFLVGVTALTFGAAWLADRPGDVTVNWLGYQVETSIMVTILALLALVVLTVLIWSILRGIVRAPGAIAARRLDRRARRAYRAISNGIVSIGAGDAQAARRYANEAQRLAPKEPLALLLGAQAAQLAGNPADAERTFKAMASRDDTKLLGLHGLFIEAQRSDNAAAARTYAEDAAKEAPSLAWAAEAVLQYRAAAGDWVGAVAALERNMRNGLIAKDVYRRQRAVLLTGRAMSGEVGTEDAKALALEALKLSPGLVPAASLAGRLLTETGHPRKAARVIEKAFAINPHPDLVETYANIHPRESNRDRLGRIRRLAQLAPKHPESAMATARAAIDAQEFSAARNALTPMLTMPTQRMAALMAELEEKQSGDVGRAREWMRRALVATRDPTWTADGLVTNKWLPASPTTGRIDAFEWRIPIADLAQQGPVIEHDHAQRSQIAAAPPPPPAASKEVTPAKTVSSPPPAPPAAKAEPAPPPPPPTPRKAAPPAPPPAPTPEPAPIPLPAPKAEAKPVEAKVDSKPEPKVEAKREAKVEAKADESKREETPSRVFRPVPREIHPRDRAPRSEDVIALPTSGSAAKSNSGSAKDEASPADRPQRPEPRRPFFR